MCGITLSIVAKAGANGGLQSKLHESLAQANSVRGPDSHSTYRQSVVLGSNDEVDINLTSSVLGLRGGLTIQPIVGETGALAWNGQVFDGLPVNTSDNDTRAIFDLLDSGSDFEEVLAGVEGPYACVWYNRNSQTIHFQVDPLSRRSLLISLPTASNPTFALSSTRSAYARENGIEMRALLGGEGGVLHLEQIRVDESGALDVGPALKMRLCFPGPSKWVRVEPINTLLPSFDSAPSESFAREEVSCFEEQLQKAVRSRICNIPDPKPDEARVAVLFSGGVDCTLLACMIHRCLPEHEPIELVNVAFQRSKGGSGSNVSKAKGWKKPPKTQQLNSRNPTETIDTPIKSALEADAVSEYDTPDRLSGYAALSELQSACPGREWRFVEVNVTYEEYHEHRQRVLDLMYPATTEMDLSLAYPLYFASRGIGTFDRVPYTVRSKVYISGLGADEQLGGYARHRHAYSVSSFPGLLTSLQTDIAQLPIRNTSRDDRILSSFARDARYPYLSLGFISYLSQVPIWAKVYYEGGEGWGDKLLLRLAAERAGMNQTARRVKRAMQFGSRSAKVDGGVKGKAAGTRKVE